ncbi:MAG TPA: ester cyclase [Leptospiraceae bacterium]|nr:ester cyclase [Spirochaetaceae bacterium]HBS07053.1 ester cyclase [Leptospiraceae bacterium]
MQPIEENKDLIRRLVRAMNERDWRGVRNTLHPDFQRHSHAAGESVVEEGEDFVLLLRGQFEAFPDGQEEILDMIGEGDRVAARHRFKGTQTGALGPFEPSHRSLVSEYIAFYRFADGRIAESWAEWDNLSALEQLGHSTEPN